MKPTTCGVVITLKMIVEVVVVVIAVISVVSFAVVDIVAELDEDAVKRPGRGRGESKCEGNGADES